MIKLAMLMTDERKSNHTRKSYAVGNIESYLKERIKNIDVVVINCFDEDYIELIREYESIAIGLYAWNISKVETVIKKIKSIYPNKTIVLGGNEICEDNIKHLSKKYLDVNYFIIGYAEESIFQILTKRNTNRIQRGLSSKHYKSNLVYSNNTIKVEKGMHVSISTKRGCPYKCSYCSYSNNDFKGYAVKEIDNIKEEFIFLNNKVKKVNILDPIFTIKNYEEIIGFLVVIKFTPTISIQQKFETFNLNKIDDIFEKMAHLDMEIEFGVQSISVDALKNSNRENDLTVIEKVVEKLKQYQIKFILTIIRGLPGETPESYEKTLRYAQSLEATELIVYPLSILINTELYNNSDKYGIVTIKHEDLYYCIETNSYSKEDYKEMINIETKLGIENRISIDVEYKEMNNINM